MKRILKNVKRVIEAGEARYASGEMYALPGEYTVPGYFVRREADLYALKEGGTATNPDLVREAVNVGKECGCIVGAANDDYGRRHSPETTLSRKFGTDREAMHFVYEGFDDGLSGKPPRPDGQEGWGKHGTDARDVYGLAYESGVRCQKYLPPAVRADVLEGRLA